MDPVIPVSKGGSRARYSGGFDETAGVWRHRIWRLLLSQLPALYLRGGLSRDISLLGRRTTLGWWIKWPILQKRWQEDTIWAEDNLERAYTLVTLCFLKEAAWTALKLDSQLFYSPFTVLGCWFFCCCWGFCLFLFLFSSDSSCHNKLWVMLEFKLLVQVEHFDFEPSDTFKPIHANKSGSCFTALRPDACWRCRGGLTLRCQIHLMPVGVKMY